MPFHSAAALALLVAAAFAVAAPPAALESPSQAPGRVGRAVERFNLGLRGVYFVENQGQWSDASVCFGLKSRGLDVAFRDSSFTMHLSRECSEYRDHSEPDCVSPASELGRVTPTSRAREEAVLGVEGSDAPTEFHDAHNLISDYAGPLADPRAPSPHGSHAPLPHGRGSSGDLLHHGIRGVEDSAPAWEHLTLAVSFPGSNAVTPRGAQEQTAKFNYFVGGEGRGTASNVPSFGAVIYEDLYDGIDLFVTGNDDGVMKYEFHCAPGADYSQIRIHYDGIDSLCVNAEGDLAIATSFGTLRDGAPIVWQENLDSLPRLGGGGPGRGSSSTDASAARSAHLSNHPHPNPPPQSRGREQSAAARQTIPARFELIDAATYRIALDATPDPSLPLVIDPEIEWMVYLGASAIDLGESIAVDNGDNSLVTGYTNSADFEGRNNSYRANYDAYALKISPTGQLQWMTFLGGSEEDYGMAIDVDSADHAIVTGYTDSADFVGQNNSYHNSYDTFTLKINPSGQLQWMTFLGGGWYEFGYDLAVDNAGHALVAGTTGSIDFEGRNNSHHGANDDAFIVKVSPSGGIQWMTYLGGGGGDFAYGVTADLNGDALVTGTTASTDFEGRNNSHHGSSEDAIAIKVSSSGAMQWMTYLGGSDDEAGYDISVDEDGNTYVSGYSESTDFEGRINSNHGGADAVVVKVSAFGLREWMTYLGGSLNENARGIVVDTAGYALVSGQTGSSDFGQRTNSHHGGASDAYIAMVSPSGLPRWMTYLGGSGYDYATSIMLDDAGNTLLAGSTDSADFEGRTNFNHGGDKDAFTIRLASFNRLHLTVMATCPLGGPISVSWTDGTPEGRIAMIFARSTGDFIVPARYPCQGTQLNLGIDLIQLVGVYRSGANGERTINGFAGNGACGGYLQLLDLATCGTSNVARIE